LLLMTQLQLIILAVVMLGNEDSDDRRELWLQWNKIYLRQVQKQKSVPELTKSEIRWVVYILKHILLLH
jgi:hypothetical protein